LSASAQSAIGDAWLEASSIKARADKDMDVDTLQGATQAT